MTLETTKANQQAASAERGGLRDLGNLLRDLIDAVTSAISVATATITTLTATTFTSDDSSIGINATSVVGFFGATGTAQQTVTAVATGATIADVVASLQALQAALNGHGIVLDGN